MPLQNMPLQHKGNFELNVLEHSDTEEAMKTE